LSAAWNREGAIEPGETCVAEQLLCQLTIHKNPNH